MEMLERFENLYKKAEKKEDYECSFNCLNVIMGIKSNLELEKAQRDQEAKAKMTRDEAEAQAESVEETEEAVEEDLPTEE